ncbi:dynein beta chain, ciliary [Condylostylus longicornis]|uniref:dynein beta chain, ciliary n=1 Tax=Condylostylus longicornis TaxID=2530218 RepID=UPI00244E22CB|nr:dynein beta chain, ciliary [Condylostylus longicornis]
MGDQIEEEIKIDPRIEWIQNYILKTMKAKNEKWIKLTDNSRYLNILLNFLDNSTVRQVVFYGNAAGLLCVSHDYPPEYNSKLVYFVRKTSPYVFKSAENIRKGCYIGELPPKPLETISSLLDDLWIPFLKHKANQNNWTQVMVQEVPIQNQIIQTEFVKMKGYMKNRTILPLPTCMSEVMEISPQIAQGNLAIVTVSIKDGLEDIVLEWFDTVNELTKLDIEARIIEISATPIPEHLFKFWQARLENLEDLVQQLCRVRIRTVGFVLEKIGSIFLKLFHDLVHNALNALEQAKDINIHYKPVKTIIDNMESLDLEECRTHMRPLLITTCLTWSYSKYASTVENMALLFKLIFNSVIECAIRTLQPDTLFQGEIEDTLKKVRMTKKNLLYFREVYNEMKTKRNYFKRPSNPFAQDWTWQSTYIFERYDLFLIRLNELHNCFEIGSEFTKLDKICVGGFKGKAITLEVRKISDSFQTLYAEWGNIQYNPLEIDPKLKSFQQDLKKFNSSADILERKLAFQFEKYFEVSHDLNSTLQFVELCGSLLHRPVIKHQIYDNLQNIVEEFDNELSTVKLIFNEYKNSYKENGIMKLKVVPYLTPTSGALCWLRSVRARILSIFREFPFTQYLEILNNEYGQEVIKRYREMMKYLENFEKEILYWWRKYLLKSIRSGAQRTIFRKLRDGTIEVNFDQELKVGLNDIRSIRSLDYRISSEALEFYNLQNNLTQSKFEIQRIEEWYNEVLKKSHPCEYDMLRPQMEVVENLLEPFLNEIIWFNIDTEKLHALYVEIKSVNKRLMRTQFNIGLIRNSIRSWGNIPLYKRQPHNNKSFIDFENRKKIMKSRFLDCITTKELIKKLINFNLKLFYDMPDIQMWVESSSEVDIRNSILLKQITTGVSPIIPEDQVTSQDEMHSQIDLNEIVEMNTEETLKLLDDEERHKFIVYENYLDTIIVEELKAAIKTSIRYLKNEMDDINENEFPIAEITICLKPPNIFYDRNIDLDDPQGFYQYMEEILQDIFRMAIMLTKSAPTDQTTDNDTYMDELCEKPSLTKVRDDILNKIRNVMSQIKNYVQSEYGKSSFIWKLNRSQYLKDIKMYGRPLNNFEREDETLRPKPIKESLENLPLNLYKNEIKNFTYLFEEIDQKWDLYYDFIWLRLNTKQFKKDVLEEVNNWINFFKDDLIKIVEDCLQELDDFIAEALTILYIDLDKNDFDGLIKTIKVLQKIADNQVYYDSMFDPLKNIVKLLKSYDYAFPEKVFKQFQDLPDEWKKIKRELVNVKTLIEPIKTYQIDLIDKRVNLQNIRSQIFRNKFLKKSFFFIPCPHVYKLIDEEFNRIKTLEQNIDLLDKQAKLLELPSPVRLAIEVCLKELKAVKILWDHVIPIETTIEDWKTTPWKKIDIESMDSENKKFNRSLKALDSCCRTWEPYIYAELLLKNLMTSLRAVVDLQNPAIKSRHWQQLMDETKIKFDMTDSTTLANLLDLGLHRFEEEVKNIVEKSIKEAAIEKDLSEISSTWAGMVFETDLHERTNLQILRPSEELIEILEDNQNRVQNMMSSKYVGYFEKQVFEWQKKLSNTDAVISSWFEVQRKWQYLENIFIGSEDIRSQLPEDSSRFDAIDKDFKNLLINMIADKYVIKACNRSGLVDKLERLGIALSFCEKALNDYLETKRLAYPRFYFISSADLLDILSNSNKPVLVCRHLTKLYDSMGKLTFLPSGKTANGMVAKELDEYVPFLEKCDCSGKVEIWLNRVTSSMRDTLRDHLRRAVVAYDEKPRDTWLFEWPAQSALVGSQIWWTFETNKAFMKLDMGYENAMKEYNKQQINQLNSLIMLLLSDLTAADRQKIMTICTIDVHQRDVVAKMIALKVESISSFQWQTQLRHRWDEARGDCFANICDAQFCYDYEFLGNTPRLVVTPLTDRCYITLTQSLHLVMGGAPAGPAGTGKTETTKDLGRALGIMVYVFNCSEQMDYKSVGNIHKGLAQTGAWGCFDEFNRISVSVLSVIAVQVKCIQDAIKGKKKILNFLGEMISLKPTVGVFITMNPGYAGRAELPENLKALYRPCAMVVPDFALIAEIMLVAEGFQEARLLARKFITLYTLCKELLSKQDHYDWGLRAIKSVLVVAGSLRRDDRHRPEDQVLMRALRDFNTPKIVTDDLPVFIGLIGDLFPNLNVPRKRNQEFEEIIKKSTVELSLQPEPEFIQKVVELTELFAVRHSVFIVGFAGTGKSEVWKVLQKTYHNMNRKPFYNDLNPKAVTNDELFGIVNPSTREWKDGLFSIIMRDQANMSGDGPKWIVLDGDIDPMWIESLNTVMDDNKVLTLASNERIALTKDMRLLFEIANLKTATPATVSRAGILYINPQDLSWNPFVASWLSRRSKSEQSVLGTLFDRYIPSLLENSKKGLKKITPISDIAMIQMTCYLLNCLLVQENLPIDCPKDWYEIYFAFACIWGFGSCLFQDQIIDWRNEFSKWFISEFKSVKFPPEGTVFDYYVDQETKALIPWTNLVENFELETDKPLQSNLVPTSETTRLRYFMDVLLEAKNPIMLIGPAGSGKTILMNYKLNALVDKDSTKWAVTNVPFNFYTTSEALQRILEKPLEKKAGRNFGPPGNKNMLYFVDDMNMPEVDKYGTVQPHTLIRQFMDYKHWYDRVKMILKDIHSCQFVSCMNPSAGSFTIDPRLQRHFCSFAVNQPGSDALHHILNSILSQHLAVPTLRFSTVVKSLCNSLVNAAIALHQKVSSSFLPTAVKFHYNFNLRDIANIFVGILYGNSDSCPNSDMMIRLWFHESQRVYGDKLVDFNDINNFKKIAIDTLRKNIDQYNEEVVLLQPLIYCHFARGLSDMKYMPIQNWLTLQTLLKEAQHNYNEVVGAMNLVLFEDAMSHICRISRILESSRGYALLIGVGGSGKQSLTRLAAFISSLDVFKIQLTKDFSIVDLKANLNTLYIKAGIKNTPNCFLVTDSEIAKEEFLVVINDLLASGDIPELFADDEVENIISTIRNEVKEAGISDTRENCWKFFIEKVRSLIKVVLCFSPVGSTLRIRARKFPSLVNCTTINWFHGWPIEALESVSYRFLNEFETLHQELALPISKFMAYVHTSVNKLSEVYLANDRRYNYTTPKSFLELIKLYRKLVIEKDTATKEYITRLENGLIKLASCSKEVDDLQFVLKDQEVILKIKNEEADALIKVVSAENEKVSKERAFVSEEEKKVRTIEEEVTAIAAVCTEEYKAAMPALEKAQEALNTLNKNNLTELKSFGSPPDAVVNVVAAVLVLFSPKGKIPKDRSWKACRGIMGNVDKFMQDLIYYKKESIPPDVIKALQPYLKDPEFDPHKIMAKSGAAAGLCSWVININNFYEVYLEVEPKIRALKDAEYQLNAAREKLESLNNRLNELEEELNAIQSEFNAAMAEKQKCQDEADKTAFTIDIANRLVGGLASEKIRWTASVKNLNESLETIPGDMLLIACFISYVGCFTRSYRSELQEKMWLPTFKKLEPQIPMTENVDLFSLICDDAQIAQWNNQGLPNDRMSSENAAILVYSERYPLIIDPQLQGIKWVKQRYAKNMTLLRLNQKGYMDMIEKAVRDGNVLVIENIGESIDAVLNPLVGRYLIKKGTCLRLGDREIDFNPKFRLILQTKLANPHYKPEMQAQCTLINFTVTRDGLEDQLLAEVVKAERADLESLRTKLTQQQNQNKITLKILEEDLLKRLAAAGDNVLEDVSLVTNLEKTKRTVEEIGIKVAEAKITTSQIDSAREIYRPAACRASIIYFVMNELFKINAIYQFSLKSFTIVFLNAIKNAPESDNVKERVSNLVDTLTFFSYMYTSRALFEADKLIFLTQMIFQIQLHSKEIEQSELDFLLRYPYNPNVISEINFLNNVQWGGIKALSSYCDSFKGLDKDLEAAPKRWQKILDADAPEREKLPGEWKNKTSLQRLCIWRCLRADRMTYAVQVYIEEKLGTKYIEARSVDFAKTFEETSSEIHTFFVLSPGVDPLKDVERVGKYLGWGFETENFHSVSLGQGQEMIAEKAIEEATREGHWVMLQNIHLVAHWLPRLEKTIEGTVGNSHPDYRLFLSAEPAPSHEFHILPQGILESAIKVTNEPPTGMLANLHKALDNFTQETLEMCSKETEFKAILFSLCYFHAAIAERRKFGAQGWNVRYPFNVGDLTISVYVLHNYLEANTRVPWEDLRYLFGEIMYGGHITDDWDRRLCRTYLEEYMQPELLNGELYYTVGFKAPGILNYDEYHSYINENLPTESPILYGLHANAEIGFLTTVTERIFRIIFELQPKMAAGAGPGEMTQEEIVKILIEDTLDKIPLPFNIVELSIKAGKEKTPYIIVALQEADRMNILNTEIVRSLKELEMGLKGELTISSVMESLMDCLYMDQVPVTWEKLAYPSILNLGSWIADLMQRLKELETWVSDFKLPSSVWLGGFFNPQSFLTAIMQQTARKNDWPLDRMCLNCDVTKKHKSEIAAAPREGSYVNGLFMEGARWDIQLGTIADARMKELFPSMPVIYIKAITQDKQDLKNIYECPLYKIRKRGPTFVWTFNLKTKEKPGKWTLAGVCLLLQI